MPISLSVSNEVWFPDSFNVAGYYINVQAQSIFPNGTYHVDIYDNTGYNILALSGTNDSQGYITYQGARGFLVQNYDPGTLEEYSNPFYNVAVRATAAGGGAMAISTNFIWVESPWPAISPNNLYTQWEIAYQPVFGNPVGGSLSQIALQSMIQACYDTINGAFDGGVDSGALGVYGAIPRTRSSFTVKGASRRWPRISIWTKCEICITLATGLRAPLAR